MRNLPGPEIAPYHEYRVIREPVRWTMDIAPSFPHDLAAMWETVQVPVWAVWLTLILALIALLDRVIGPSVRWFFRKRINRAIDELNERLHVRIQPFKLTKRRVLIERLVYDAEVMAAVEEHTAETGMPRDAAVAPLIQAWEWFCLTY